LKIEEGSWVGVVGERGGGKSRLGGMILGLEKGRGGEVVFEGEDVYGGDQERRKDFRRDVEGVFEDWYWGVNGRWRVEEILCEVGEKYEM
ncbi:ATP-binding cassette domain-containing protein, partial [Bacillus sp. WP8]|uniref:ATP-binding cassette domain-containing protein n=1 Tax=Bacillus sp. WP8 TaxID=756828 RepID=UPI00119C9643